MDILTPGPRFYEEIPPAQYLVKADIVTDAHDRQFTVENQNQNVTASEILPILNEEDVSVGRFISIPLASSDEKGWIVLRRIAFGNRGGRVVPE